MRVQLLPFGIFKDFLETGPIEVPSDATVADLLGLLREQAPQDARLSDLLPRIAVSVNAEYAEAGHLLREGDQVGLLPPVSGGSEDVAGMQLTYLTREVIDAQRLIDQVKQGSDGAVVVFDGIVRDNTRGRRTLYLDYEAYEEMAEKRIAELAGQARAQFGIRGVTLVHRLGRLEIGETSVLIVVASAHRAAAFDACRWLIDTLKKTVPIWKKETFADGVVWADGEPFPPELSLGAANDILSDAESKP
ncbi:molybdenum cofactor biosynthesis protein MoaE [Acidicapsa dinghuensis]|uniref:Molybdopterin synthase catalytic subunit n=1 Tax=Acidicapsa dinghuensis TaxID=2218256 RepID=A0ABW1EKM3_9BACT|nr:molybdenum cofactor biosynthesis protein MoaE [Acidicapsa dinghuensis]